MMTRLLSLWLVVWVHVILAFDFYDLDKFTDAFSPGFNLELSSSHDGFEFQREPEGAFAITDQTPTNTNEYRFGLTVEMDILEDDGVLLERQTRTCPPGTYMCANGRCCQTGKTCVPGGCCPAGNQQCGSRNCYNPSTQVCCSGGTKSCPKGYYCTATGCCKNGSKPCGTGCYDPNKDICCSGSGTCPKSSTCVPNGCCPKGTKACGRTKCYNPNTETCCAAGSGLCSRQDGLCPLDQVCSKDKTCAGANGCCPKGQKACGAKSCYDPKTETCCEDTGEHCPKNYECMKGGNCCPKGMIKCGTDKCYDPKRAQCCKDAGQTKFWACLNGYGCCAASGKCFDPKSQNCCAGGPCPKSQECCNGKCCTADQRCTKTGRCIKKSKPKTKTKTSTSTSSTCTTPTATRPAPAAKKTIEFVYDPKRSVRDRRVGAKPGTRWDVSNHAVLWNMCRGIKKLNGGRPDQQYTLTKGDACWKERNRDIMCPTGFCANAVEEFVKQFYPDGIPSWAQEAITAASDLQCDEFPFASSLQGGDLVNGVTICLPADDNGFQGATMGKYFQDKTGGADIIPGEDFVIKITGWSCKDQEPDGSRRRRDLSDDLPDEWAPLSWSGLRKRDAFEDPIERYGEEMFHGFDADKPKLNLMTMPLGDLSAGTYFIDLNITKGNFSYLVVDSDGQSFEPTLLSNGSVQFTLDDDWPYVFLTGTTEEEDVEMSYKAESIAEPIPTESPSDPGTATATDEAPEPSATDEDDLASSVSATMMSAIAPLVLYLVL